MRSKRRPSSAVLGAAIMVSFLLSTFSIVRILSPITTDTIFPVRPLKLPARKQQDRRETPLLSEYGRLMVRFLPEDLPFTIFVPAPGYLENMLASVGQNLINSSTATVQDSSLQDSDGTLAFISRIFGFSAVPRRVWMTTVPLEGELALESLSGHRLYVSRHPYGSLTVNNIFCSRTDMAQGSTVIHLVEGVLMDSEFEQSFLPSKEDEDDGRMLVV